MIELCVVARLNILRPPAQTPAGHMKTAVGAGDVAFSAYEAYTTAPVMLFRAARIQVFKRLPSGRLGFSTWSCIWQRAQSAEIQDSLITARC